MNGQRIATRDWVRVFSNSEGSYIERVVTEVVAVGDVTMYRIDGFGALKAASELRLIWREDGGAV